jgi:hypothetical protein
MFCCAICLQNVFEQMFWLHNVLAIKCFGAKKIWQANVLELKCFGEHIFWCSNVLVSIYFGAQMLQ